MSNICQTTIPNEELSSNNMINDPKRNTDYFAKTPHLKPTFQISKYTNDQQKFLTIFNFQLSRIAQ